VVVLVGPLLVEELVVVLVGPLLVLFVFSVSGVGCCLCVPYFDNDNDFRSPV